MRCKGTAEERSRCLAKKDAAGKAFKKELNLSDADDLFRDLRVS
jgi:hypothetical protein